MPPKPVAMSSWTPMDSDGVFFFPRLQLLLRHPSPRAHTRGRKLHCFAYFKTSFPLSLLLLCSQAQTVLQSDWQKKRRKKERKEKKKKNEKPKVITSQFLLRGGNCLEHLWGFFNSLTRGLRVCVRGRERVCVCMLVVTLRPKQPSCVFFFSACYTASSHVTKNTHVL